MRRRHPARWGRRGITVLSLLLLIIAVIIAVVLFVRYFGSPAAV